MMTSTPENYLEHQDFEAELRDRLASVVEFKSDEELDMAIWVLRSNYTLIPVED